MKLVKAWDPLPSDSELFIGLNVTPLESMEDFDIQVHSRADLLKRELLLIQEVQSLNHLLFADPLLHPLVDANTHFIFGRAPPAIRKLMHLIVLIAPEMVMDDPASHVAETKGIRRRSGFLLLFAISLFARIKPQNPFTYDFHVSDGEVNSIL